MHKNFLVAFDGSEHANKALGLAASLALQSSAHLDILHVVPMGPPSGINSEVSDPDVKEEMRRRYEFDLSQSTEIIHDAEAVLTEAMVQQFSSHIREGVVAGEIIGFIKSHNIDLIFMGNRGLNDFKGMPLGSVAQKVVPLAPCTCVVVK